MSYDLTKVGPVREDVLVKVRDSGGDGVWHGPYPLLSISTVYGVEFTVWEMTEPGSYEEAKLYEPPVKRPMTHPEIFKAIREGAVVREKVTNLPSNFWSRIGVPSENEICYNYTDTEADVWEEMEVDGE